MRDHDYTSIAGRLISSEALLFEEIGPPFVFGGGDALSARPNVKELRDCWGGLVEFEADGEELLASR